MMAYNMTVPSTPSRIISAGYAGSTLFMATGAVISPAALSLSSCAKRIIQLPPVEFRLGMLSDIWYDFLPLKILSSTRGASGMLAGGVLSRGISAKRGGRAAAIITDFFASLNDGSFLGGPAVTGGPGGGGPGGLAVANPPRG